jgi:uroporphyrinogen-III synthase
MKETGLRVLLTRPVEEAERTARRLARVGCSALIAPVLELAAVPAILGDDAFDAVVATSAQAIRFADFSDEIMRRNTPLWAVGERTAREAQARGWTRIEVVAKDSAALAQALALCPAARTWLYLAGAPRSPALEEAMKAQNKRLSMVVVYESRPVEMLPAVAAQALRAEAIDAVLHFSPRSASVFVDLVRAEHLVAAAQRPLHVAISPRAAEPLDGFPNVRAAARPDEASMLETLLGAVGKRPLRS